MLALPALLLAAVAIPYRYELTLAEPDLVRMMAALVYGSATGLEAAAGMHYGMKFSFGWYELVYALVPDAWLQAPDFAARMINGAGLLAGLACAWICTLYLRALFGVRAAVAAALVFFLSPAMLAVSFSGHPLLAAAACLFGGGLLLLRWGEAQGVAKWLLAGAAWALLVLGLSIRAEVVLAFPFLWLAHGRAALVPRAVLLGAAFAAFLFLQREHVIAAGGAAGSLFAFLESFVSAARLGRGAVVLVLATGIVTMLCAVLAVARLGLRQLWLPAVLALPALALWLPNPQPARHFFFVSLAVALALALALQRWQGSGTRVVLAALLVAVSNQLAAELVHPLIASRYAWSYPQAAERRATQQVPIGAFPFDQRANQALAAAERAEAVALARELPQRLLVLADFHHYLIAHFIAADPALRWSEAQEKGVLYATLRSPSREIVLVQKYEAWPRDVAAEVLADARWAGWPVHVQPTSISRYDRTAIPPERVHTFPESSHGR